MLEKGTKLYSILTGSCPKCHEERMYVSKNAYNPWKTLKMHSRCGHCGTIYSMEPSFFYGAMYVSYSVGTAVAIVAFMISFLFLETSLETAFISIVVTLVLSMPIMMRLSRNIWINFFIDYDADAAKK